MLSKNICISAVPKNICISAVPSAYIVLPKEFTCLKSSPCSDIWASITSSEKCSDCSHSVLPFCALLFFVTLTTTGYITYLFIYFLSVYHLPPLNCKSQRAETLFTVLSLVPKTNLSKQ